MIYDIESPSNRRIIDTARLKQRRARRAAGRFLVEGTREVSRALDAGIPLVEAFLCPDLAPPGTVAVGDRLPAADTPVTAVSPAAFEKLSMRQNPDGIVAVARTWSPDPATLNRSLILVAEAIEKPGNLGAMLRTADATGAGLLVADPTVDVFNPNVVRASQGAVFSVPFATAGAADAAAWATAHGPVYVATPEATTAYWDVDLSGKAAIVVGSEHAGVSNAWDGVGTPIRIPMAGTADSLNASVSAAVLLYEAVRQRA